jgi:hypothetical protein
LSLRASVSLRPQLELEHDRHHDDGARAVLHTHTLSRVIPDVIAGRARDLASRGDRHAFHA